MPAAKQDLYQPISKPYKGQQTSCSAMLIIWTSSFCPRSSKTYNNYRIIRMNGWWWTTDKIIHKCTCSNKHIIYHLVMANCNSFLPIAVIYASPHKFYILKIHRTHPITNKHKISSESQHTKEQTHAIRMTWIQIGKSGIATSRTHHCVSNWKNTYI